MKTQPSQVITVVSGLPRSGTSLMMRMLEAGGLDVLTDGVRQADSQNPHGYYEVEEAKQLHRGESRWIARATGKVVKIIFPLLRFLPPEHQYRVVAMSRPMEEILASQRVMLTQRGQPDASLEDQKMARIYQQNLWEVREWLREQPHFRAHFVSYCDLILNPDPEVDGVNQFLGGSLDTEAMTRVIDPSLYRQRR